MKNILKRIAAMGAPVMMMSSMAIGASAADSKAFSLRNTPGAPSSDNVTSKTLNFKTTQSGKYTTYTKLTASKNTTVTTKCYVWKNNTWNLITTSTGTQKTTGSWYQITVGMNAKNVVSITKNASKATSASGSTFGY